MSGSTKKSLKGRFVPQNPEKYIGNVKNIIFRSSWELSFARFLDRNERIINWSSEEIAIPYIKPTTKHVHRYYPDFWIRYKDRDGQLIEEIVEIKPEKEQQRALFIIEHEFKVMPPVYSKNPKTRMYEQLTMLINAAKWQSAIKWCKARNMRFRVLNENSLFK